MTTRLGIDASAPEVSAAVVSAGVLQAEARVPAAASGEVLLTLVNEVLEKAGMSLGQIDEIAVGIGPGSFTGIRNGIATAQGLATRLPPESGVMVYGVSSLLALAVPLPPDVKDLRLISFPANAQESFCVLVGGDGKERMEVLSAAFVLPTSEVAEEAEALQRSFRSEGRANPALCSNETAALGVGPTLAARAAMLGFLPPSFPAEGLGEIDERKKLFQECIGGRGLEAVYAKPVQAKTLQERGIVLTRVK